MSIVYPVSRLLANPKIFYAIANYLGGPDGDTLKEAFYSLLEFDFTDQEPEDCEFEPEEVMFESENDGAIFTIQLDTGLESRLEAVQDEVRAEITTDEDLAKTSAIYRELVIAIEEADPDLEGDIALCSPPTPGNSFLLSSEGKHFMGDFHLLSDPEKKFSFIIRPSDTTEPGEPENKLKATIKPI
jgi:hypothetical protein